MGRAWNNDQLFFQAVEFRQGLLVQFDHGPIISSNDQQGWGSHQTETLPRQVRPSSTGDDGSDLVSGTFFAKPEGAYVFGGSRAYQISYLGGTWVSKASGWSQSIGPRP